MRNILIRIQLDSRYSYFKSQDKKMVIKLKVIPKKLVIHLLGTHRKQTTTLGWV